MPTKPAVVIFREQLLPISETFIRSQVGSLKMFRGVYAGCQRVSGLELSGAPVVTLDNGALGDVERGIFKLTGWVPRLTSRLRRYNPVLLHAHFGKDGAAAIGIARNLRIPMTVTFHGFDATLTDQSFGESPSGRRYLRNRDALKKAATKILAVSDFIASKLFEQGFPREKVQVHYIGVDTEEFGVAPEVGRERRVLFVGRLVEKKGCEYLIRAMESIQNEMPEVELVVAGDGPLRGSLETLAKSLLRRFRFVGAQSSTQIRELMNGAMVLSTPSVVADSGDAEGFGMVFIEAQSSGLPVVSFASGGVPEAVKHGEGGYLAPERDWRTLGDYIGCLLKNSAIWTRFSRAGRERVEQCFDLRRQTAKLEEIYGYAVESRGR